MPDKLKIAIPLSNDGSSVRVNQAYIEYVRSSGYIPVPLAEIPDLVGTYTKLCDGLLLPGGQDIDPMFYGVNNDSSYNVNPTRDQFERALLHSFIKDKKPVFGICRGFQLIAYEFIQNYDARSKPDPKLALYQHIGNHDKNSSLKVSRHIPTHFVTALHNVLYKNDIGWQPLAVNSMHHQYLYCGIEEVKIKMGVLQNCGVIVTSFTKEGLSSKDNGIVIESFEIPSWRAAAVQWHPEELLDIRLLSTFFNKYTMENLLQKEGLVIKQRTVGL